MSPLTREPAGTARATARIPERWTLMKAVVMDRYGTPDVLELRNVAKPTPKADHVLVRVLAASVNDWDWGLLRGGAGQSHV